MTTPNLDLDNALWRFVLPFYGRAGVSPACLTLQDKIGVDVNIVLFAASRRSSAASRSTNRTSQRRTSWSRAGARK